MLKHLKEYFWKGSFGNLNNSLQYICLHPSGDDEQRSLWLLRQPVACMSGRSPWKCTFPLPQTLKIKSLTFCGTTNLLRNSGKRLSLWLFFSFSMPGDIGLVYQVIEVTGMMAVYMLHSYPENRLCNIVYGDDIVLLLLIWCFGLARDQES